MMRRFEGKSVLVAGGTGGLGRAVSLAFLDELAKVTVTYRRQEEFLAMKNAAGARESSLEGYQLDVTDEAVVRQLIESILRNYGRLDVLVNAMSAYAAAHCFGNSLQLPVVNSPFVVVRHIQEFP
jgi:NAD(P)-dependent dehydrogenase (short-subunit alcohol dehydrogenase family)